jgi:hypothetical protein
MGIPIGLAKAVGRRINGEGFYRELELPRKSLTERVENAPVNVREEKPLYYQGQQPKY